MEKEPSAHCTKVQTFRPPRNNKRSWSKETGTDLGRQYSHLIVEVKQKSTDTDCTFSSLNEIDDIGDKTRKAKHTAFRVSCYSDTSSFHMYQNLKKVSSPFRTLSHFPF